MDTGKRLSSFGLGLLATASLLAGGSLLGESAIAQQVTNVTPTGQEVPTNSSIAWQFDNVSLVDVASIKVFLNNQDVTRQSIIDGTRNYFGYRPPQALAAGAYEVRVEFRNKQGANFVARWPFTVAAPNPSLTISSVTHNAAEQPLGNGASFLATINGTPGATASVLLVQNGQTVRTLPASQVASGVYVASLTVGANDTVREGVLIGRLEKGGEVIYSVASQAFAFNPGATTTPVTQTQTGQVTQTPGPTTVAPLDLAVTSHTNNGIITGSSGFTLSGTTAQDASVRVSVIASPPRLGPFSIGTGETLLDNATATVAADGKFSINVPRPTILQGGTAYVVTVRATRGTEVKTVELRLVQQ